MFEHDKSAANDQASAPSRVATRPWPTLGAILVSATLATACYSPAGGLMPYTGGPVTYYSTEMQQKTINLVDVRNNEVVFSMAIPPGKQLTFKFEKDAGDNPVYTPDLMRYELFDIGTKIGRLRNAVTVPNAACRRVEVSIKGDVEYAEPAPTQALRTDDASDRPAWWTPQGGPLPDESKKLEIYDH